MQSGMDYAGTNGKSRSAIDKSPDGEPQLVQAQVVAQYVKDLEQHLDAEKTDRRYSRRNNNQLGVTAKSRQRTQFEFHTHLRQ